MSDDDRIDAMIPREPEWSRFRGFGQRGMGIVLAVLGLLILALGLIQYLDGGRSSSWPSVTGRVEATEVVRRSRGSGLDREYHYTIRVTYAYVVDDVTHRNDVRSRGFSWLGGDPHFVGRFESPERAAEMAEQAFPVRSEVEVFYDPERPRVSCLERGPGRALEAVFGGVAALLAGLGLYVWGRRRRSRVAGAGG